MNDNTGCKIKNNNWRIHTGYRQVYTESHERTILYKIVGEAGFPDYVWDFYENMGHKEWFFAGERWV